MLESELLREFINNGFIFNISIYENYRCLTEVQIGNKIPDIILVNDDLTDIIAIELKIKKWKDALIQALNYQLWAKKSYIALPFNHINGALENRDIFEKVGVGIISISDSCKIEIEAKNSMYIINTYLNIAKEIIKSKLNEGTVYEC